jgi:hypothetical protein
MGFEWLLEQIRSVKMRKFFLIDGPLQEEKCKIIDESPLFVPSSYKIFVKLFGNAKLYRSGSQYMIQIYSVPQDVAINGEGEFLQFGKTDVAPVFFNKMLLVQDQESPVYEWNKEDGIVKVNDSFENWLMQECNLAKNQFSQEKWEEIG